MLYDGWHLAPEGSAEGTERHDPHLNPGSLKPSATLLSPPSIPSKVSGLYLYDVKVREVLKRDIVDV